MGTRESQQFASILTQRVGDAAPAAAIGSTLFEIWGEIDAVLSPILGERGVALLYKRSIFLAMHDHPWLAITHEGAHTAMHVEGLETAFAGQSNPDAAAAGQALLLKFHELLGSLIGPSLTERLLHPVSGFLKSGEPAQDMTP